MWHQEATITKALLLTFSSIYICDCSTDFVSFDESEESSQKRLKKLPAEDIAMNLVVVVHSCCKR